MGKDVLDTGQIMASSHPVRRGEELWFYYSGIDVRHRPNRPRPIDEYRGAIFLAKLRVDGFVSLRGGAEEGFLDTRPLVLEGSRLWVNAAVQGSLAVEITEPDGRTVLPGWERGSMEPLSGDHTRAEIRWRGRDLSELAGKRVRVRFHLRDADLYSLWLE
jgi:hypothetical protein